MALHTGTLTLGGIVLGETDAYGVDWVLERIVGWSSSAGTTGATDQRASDHGGWNSSAHYTPRVVEVEGSLIAPTWDDATAAIDRLMAAVPLSTPEWLVVDEGGTARQSLVRQDGELLIEQLSGWARFSLPLIAADPRRYSVDETTVSTGLPVTTGGLSLPTTLPFTIGATTAAGVLTATNEGNMATRPTFTLTGPVPAGSRITRIGSGKSLYVPHEIAAGRTLTIDTDRRRALLDGTAARVVTGTWFEFEPGDNEVGFSAPTYNSEALLSTSYRSAYR